MKVSYISLIEPYIYDKNGNMSLGSDLTKVICGNKEDCKIVSMRLYDERCAEDDGTPITGTWDSRQEEIQQNTVNKYHTDCYEDFFVNYVNDNHAKTHNTIVDYKGVN